MILAQPVEPPHPAEYAVMIYCEEVPAQGPEAEWLRQSLRTMRAHLSVPAQGVRSSTESELEDYEHVPLTRIGTIRVHYRKGGTLKPRSVWSERADG